MAADKKTTPIKYTARDFETIKSELVQYAKRYYPDSYKDFNEASFGSLMLDTVAYVGDVLSFYVDYQANESFLDTAIEYQNVLKLGRQQGYKFRGVPSSYGVATFYILIPAKTTGIAPDLRYMPVLQKGSTFRTGAGLTFTLVEDVHFDQPNNEVRVGRVDSGTGTPTAFAVKAFGTVISGEVRQKRITIRDYKKFRQINLGVMDVAEIISVVDNEGHEYFEVPYLSQDVIYRPITNTNADRDYAPALLKPFHVPRRFIVEKERRQTRIIFGASSDVKVSEDYIADPASVVLKRYGKDYISDTSFDPTRLIESDKFGIAPANTTLTITYRKNSADMVNSGAHTLTKVSRPLLHFRDLATLDAAQVKAVKKTLEVDNESPIVGDVSVPDGAELKIRIRDVFATQDRAVTQKDYESMVYNMPPEFGAIKRCKVVRDHDSLKRNLNIYVLSESTQGLLTQTNATIKENLKIWLNENKMINDTIDIIDGKIVNFGVNYKVVGRLGVAKYDVQAACQRALKRLFRRKADFGEPLFITDIFSSLNRLDAVTDVSDVKIVQKYGGSYSDIRFDIDAQTSADGRYISVPDNVLMELRFHGIDFKGVVT
jgi:hypothetical protein